MPGGRRSHTAGVAAGGGQIRGGSLRQQKLKNLATSVVPLYPFFSLGVSLLELNIRKKGTLIMKGLLGNLGMEESAGRDGEAAPAGSEDSAFGALNSGFRV